MEVQLKENKGKTMELEISSRLINVLSNFISILILILIKHTQTDLLNFLSVQLALSVIISAIVIAIIDFFVDDQPDISAIYLYLLVFIVLGFFLTYNVFSNFYFRIFVLQLLLSCFLGGKVDTTIFKLLLIILFLIICSYEFQSFELINMGSNLLCYLFFSVSIDSIFEILSEVINNTICIPKIISYLIYVLLKLPLYPVAFLSLLRGVFYGLTKVVLLSIFKNSENQGMMTLFKGLAVRSDR